MNAITPFLFEGEHVVREIEIANDPWFVAADVCRIIDIRDVSQAVGKLDDDEKGAYSIQTLGGMQEVLIVSESGLYTLILRSRDATKPGTVAHRLRKWVTGEVLPSIRRTGAYSAPRIDPPFHSKTHDEWTLEELRAKISEVKLYSHTLSTPAGAWMLERLGFPLPPPELRPAWMRQGNMLDGLTITFGREG